jgi:DNA-binding MarR family transcriptional regulator
MYPESVVTTGELYRLARVLREVALAATAEPGEPRPAPGLVAVTEDIARHVDTTVGEIATRTGLAQSLVSTVVAKLKAAGVVHTRPDDSDRRRVRIGITEEARAHVFAARGARTLTSTLHERFPDLSPDRVARIEALLDQLVTELEP